MPVFWDPAGPPIVLLLTHVATHSTLLLFVYQTGTDTLCLLIILFIPHPIQLLTSFVIIPLSPFPIVLCNPPVPYLRHGIPPNFGIGAAPAVECFSS